MKNIQTGIEEIKQLASKLRKRKPNIKPKKIYKKQNQEENQTNKRKGKTKPNQNKSNKQT